MLKKVLISLFLVSGVSLIILLYTTTPTALGPFGVLVFFILLYLLSLSIITGFIYFISFCVREITKGIVLKRPFKQITIKQSYYYSTILAMAPILILAIQSFSGIGFFEFGLVALFAVIGCFLVAKR